MEEKDEQIKMLLNEIKGIRSRLQNLITFEGRINDFDEFLKVINKIKDFIYKSENEEIKQYYEQLNLLVENYELNSQKFYNRIIQKIFGIKYVEEDEVVYNNNNEEDINNENNDVINYKIDDDKSIDNENENENDNDNDKYNNDENNNNIDNNTE